MFALRFSTASQIVPLGPFVSSTDGNTDQTSLTIANTDIQLLKSGATVEVSKDSGGATHIAGGRYYATLDATDTNTLGPMRISVHVAGALNVWLDCCVYPQVVFDAMFEDTGMGIRSNPQSIAAAPANWLTGSAVSAGAVSAIQSGLLTVTAFDAALPAGGIADETTSTNIYNRIGAPTGASVSADIAAVHSDVDTKQNTFTADTGIVFPAGGIADATTVTTETNAIYNRIGAPTGASVSADIAAVHSDVDTKQNTFTADTGILFPMNFGDMIISVSGYTQVNMMQINSVTLKGGGTTLDPWGPM